MGYVILYKDREVFKFTVAKRQRSLFIMGQRSISEIMVEGQKLTLEHAELLRKSIVSTLTSEESARKGVLEGYLLGLMTEAQAQGVGVGAVYQGESTDEVDSDSEYDTDGYDENGYDYDGYDREGYDEDGEDEDGYTRQDKEERESEEVNSAIWGSGFGMGGY